MSIEPVGASAHYEALLTSLGVRGGAAREAE
jgi:hypothetical protein